MTRPRLLIYAHSATAGGAERLIVDMAEQLDTSRLEPVVLTNAALADAPSLRSRVPSDVRWEVADVRTFEDTAPFRLRRTLQRRADGVSETVRSAQRDNLDPERRPAVIASLALLRYWANVANRRALRESMARLRPDLVFINNGNYPGAESCRLAALAVQETVGAPVIHFVHGVPEPWRWPVALERAFDRRVDAATDAWVTGAHTSSAVLAVARGFAPHRVHTVYLGQPGSERLSRDLARERLGVRDGDIALVAAGALVRVKGHDVLIDALRSARVRAPEFRLFIAGVGPAEPRLRDQVAEHGLEDVVRFLGWRDDIPHILAAADVLVHPSQAMEQMPFAVKEAMAQAVPIVATTVGGMPELVLDEVTGLLAPAADPEALAEALLRMRNGELRQRLGTAGLERVRQTFGPNRGVRELQQLCERLLRDRGPR